MYCWIQQLGLEWLRTINYEMFYGQLWRISEWIVKNKCVEMQRIRKDDIKGLLAQWFLNHSQSVTAQ